ncbi:DoxX family protein [Niabella soli]|uniref:DoxX family protein n=1 Tax=Niabella soli DSM 19437 TaxID=929713 RepID=W0EU24_9BACT|nr:DoxX family protein [Niabella soli]AHF14315.1 DoxX family protein [Niabella soli DSM 19437]
MNAKAQNSVWVVRLIPGLVFFLEGIQKFLYADTLGVGRFIKIGIPYAGFWAPFVGATEIVCGLLLIIGLFTRLAAIPLLIVMMVAFAYTKWPLLLSKGFLPMFHEYRTDFAMTLSLIFLLISGGGRYSIDWIRFNKRI